MRSKKKEEGRKGKRAESKGLMGHHQADQYTYHGSPRRRERKGQNNLPFNNLFEEIMSEDFSNARKGIVLQI